MCGPENGCCPAHLILALLKGGILAAGLSFLADLVQLPGRQGKSEQAVPDARNRPGQGRAFEVGIRQGIVRSLQIVVHGQIQAGRGFPASRHPCQHDVGISHVVEFHSVIMVQRKIQGLDPLYVFQRAAHAVCLANGMRGLCAKTGFQHRHEGGENVQHRDVMRQEQVFEGFVCQAGEHDGRAVIHIRDT